jgi:hypothetical protein
MKYLEGLFLTVTFFTVMLFYIVSKSKNWGETSVIDTGDAYWNASLSIIWGIAVLGLRNGPPVSLAMIIPILPTALIYGAITQESGMDFSFTNETLTASAISVLVIVSLLLLGFIAALLYLQRDCSSYTIFKYFLPVLVFIVWCISWLGFVVNSGQVTTNTKFFNHYESYTGYFTYHVHHWMIGIVGMLLARYPSIWSDIVAGIFWGVFCQELASYGIDIPLDFHPTNY